MIAQVTETSHETFSLGHADQLGACGRRTNDACHVAKEEAQRLNVTRSECHRATSSRFRELSRDLVLHHPVLDEHRLAAGAGKPRWPRGAPFAVCLTHDVDQAAWTQRRMHWRRLQNHFWPAVCFQDLRAARGLRSAAVELGRALACRGGSDPLACYERWLQAEQHVGARSTFLFLPDRYGKRHYSDGSYRYSDRIIFDGQPCSVGDMMREIHRRGWEVGLHASWHAFDCADEMRRQKEQVESAIDAPVVSVRHHYLHFDIRCTPRVHQQAGLLVDSSLGFNDDVGFRYGTSYPWPLRDVRTEETLSVLELPLILQDKCLIRVLAQGRLRSALEWAELMVDRVQAVGGALTLLWHPCSVRHSLYLEVYQELLAMLQRRQAWFCTMAEIAHWWMKG